MSVYDVIVVGAGPGGSAAAARLAQAGVNVLLLDRAEFPRDKPCGDAIPFSIGAELDALGLGAHVRAAAWYPITALRVGAPNGTVYQAPLPTDARTGFTSSVVPRYELDRLLWEHAVASGAHFEVGQVLEPLYTDAQVVGVRVRRTGTRSGEGGSGVIEVRAPLVIAADGATSVIGRALLTPKPGDVHRAVALRAYAEGLEQIPQTAEFYLYREILPGYSWIFPTQNGITNIGTGMRLDKFRQLRAVLRDKLAHFMHMPKIAPRVQGAVLRDIATWQLPLGSHNLSRAYAGALLVGDAGWFIDPLTGGGIANAILTARWATETALEAFAARDFSRRTLAAYDRRWRQGLREVLLYAFVFQRLLMSAPWLSDLLLARLTRWKGGLGVFMKL